MVTLGRLISIIFVVGGIAGLCAGRPVEGLLAIIAGLLVRIDEGVWRIKP